MPFLNKWKGFWPRVETRCCLLHFLTVWNSWLRQQISKIPSLDKVLLSFCFNDEGKKAVKTKVECFKAWRLFLFSSLFLSNMHYWPSVRSVYGQIPFLHFVRLYRNRLFFPSSLSTRPHALKLVFGGRLVASLAFCYRDEVEANEKRTTPISSYVDRRSLVKKGFILWTNYRGFDSQQLVLLLFSVLQVGRLPKHWFISFSRLPFSTSSARTLNVPMVHCAILSLAVAFSVLQTHLTWDT